MKRFCVIGWLILSAMLSYGAETVILCRPSMVADNYGNLTLQAFAADGITKWQFDFSVQNKQLIENKTYTLMDGMHAGYSYGFHMGDSVTRVEFRSAEFTYYTDEQGEHIRASVTGGNQAIGNHSWVLTYDPKDLPTHTPDTVVLAMHTHELSDYTRTYENFRFEGTTSEYDVTVTINSNTIPGHYLWNHASASGMYLTRRSDGAILPIEDIDVTVSATENGYLLTGNLFDEQNYVVYQVSIDYTYQPTFRKEFLRVSDYTWRRTAEGLAVQLVTEDERTFDFVVSAAEMVNLHRYSMTNGELMTDYYDADIRAFNDPDIGNAFTIEANVWMYGEPENFQYILSYVGQRKPIITTNVLPIDSVLVTYYSSDYYSEPDWYNYYLQFYHHASNPNDEFPALEVNIYQQTQPALADGTYTLDDGNMTEVILMRSLMDAIALELGGYTWQAVEASLVVRNNADGTTSFAMHIVDNEGETYEFAMSQRVQVVESRQDPLNDPYLLERRDPQSFNMTMASLEVNDDQFYTDNTIKFAIKSGDRDAQGRYYKSVLWINTDSPIPPAGIYPIAGKGELGTIDASYGYDTIAQLIYPSYFALADDRNLLYDPDIYFLVDGEVEISYPAEHKIRVEARAISWWKSTVQYVYEGDFNYQPAETETHDVLLGETTDLKNVGYLGVHEYSLQVNGEADGLPYRITLDLMPEQDRLPGTYSRFSGTFNPAKSAVEQGRVSAYRLADGAFTIAGGKDNIYTLDGWVMDEHGNRYNMLGEALYIDFVSDEQYRYEQENPVPYTYDVVFDDIIWDQSTVQDYQYMTIILVDSRGTADGRKNEAVLWFATPTALFPAGSYPINALAQDFTFYASPGNDGTGVSPCLYYQVYNKDIESVWFLVSGDVIINYPTDQTVSVEVHAQSYFGSTVNLYYNVPGHGIEHAVQESASSTASKHIVGGQLIITRDGKQYNAIGVRL